MPETIKTEKGVLAFGALGKIFFLSGVVSTAIASPFYAWQHWDSLGITTWVILFVGAPIANGFVSMVFLLVTYPVYKWLVKAKRLGFELIHFNQIVD